MILSLPEGCGYLVGVNHPPPPHTHTLRWRMELERGGLFPAVTLAQCPSAIEGNTWTLPAHTVTAGSV